MSNKELKSKEERLFELFIKEYITETEFYKIWERIKKENK